MTDAIVATSTALPAGPVQPVSIDPNEPLLRVVGARMFANRGMGRPDADNILVLADVALVGGFRAAAALESISAGASAMQDAYREDQRQGDDDLNAERRAVQGRLAQTQRELEQSEQRAKEATAKLDALWRTGDDGPETAHVEQQLAEAEGRQATLRRKLVALGQAEQQAKRQAERTYHQMAAERKARHLADLHRQRDEICARLTAHLAKAEDDLKALAVLGQAIALVSDRG